MVGAITARTVEAEVVGEVEGEEALNTTTVVVAAAAAATATATATAATIVTAIVAAATT
jgi:hypothetical protein